MKRLLLYSLFFMVLFSGCEDIYTPKIDTVENVMVADARIVYGQDNNLVRLYSSVGFYEKERESEGITGASVKLIGSNGDELELLDIGGGSYELKNTLNASLSYKLHIEKWGDTFESEFEKVPPVPKLDTVYGIPETKAIETGGSNDVDDIRKISGVQLYADIFTNPEIPNYRFTASSVMEYTWHEVTDFYEIVHYYWKTHPVSGIYNIAAPPEFSNSKDIVKHPLYFYRKSVYMEPEHYLAGWIMVLYQHAISESAHNYYKDLNAQLDAEGRIFDPVYVQARSNIKCITNSEKIILGNFEISNVVEHRYFIRYISEELGYRVEKVLDRSPIPWMGETMDIPPDFWVQ